ncbi:MAG: proline dehydrogenase family protein [Planctomycetota bacterium]|jgi:proline dehydrogenase
MSVFDGMLRAGLRLMPKRMLWLVARKYVAGSRLEDAIAAIERLRSEGYGTILDVLGEDVREAAVAEAVVADYIASLDALDAADPDCIVSAKPTHLGLAVDPALCERLLRELCTAAAAHGSFVRFEMEDATTVEATLDVFVRVRRDHENLGCVLQSRLFRTEADLERLLDEVPGLNVRLVKGIYLEPAEIAWTEQADITASYVRLAKRMLDGDAFLGLATHDAAMSREILALLSERGLDRGEAGRRRYEFQCLMGVQPGFAAAMRDEGHLVRMYVPYGKDWHAYSMRRLEHNPEIARHVMRALFRRSR